MSVELTLLGTGTPTPLVHRAGSSYLVKVCDQYLLFDCGPGAVRRLLRKGLSPTRIHTLFLTHLHYDHCVDYGYFVLVRWDQGVGRIPDLNVFGPEPTARMTDLLFNESGVYGPDLAARALGRGGQFVCQQRGGTLPRRRPMPAVTEVVHGAVIEKDDWSVKVAEVVHAQPHLICMAYRLDTHGKSIVFGGDTAPTERLTTLADGADVLIHMCHLVNGGGDRSENYGRLLGAPGLGQDGARRQRQDARPGPSHGTDRAGRHPRTRPLRGGRDLRRTYHLRGGSAQRPARRHRPSGDSMNPGRENATRPLAGRRPLPAARPLISD